MDQNGKPVHLGKAERDIVALGIATASIILFVGTGGQVVPDAVQALMGKGLGPDKLLANAMLLNIVLIVFGWRRYRELTDEIAERRKAEEHACRLAEIDPLTECLNRRSMAERTAELCLKATANSQAVAYAMIDIDDFKRVNDMNGHSVGDQMLVQVATRLRQCLPDNALLARLGGDEFAFVMVYEPGYRDRVDEIISRIYDAVGAKIEMRGTTAFTTVSIGVAAMGDNGTQVGDSFSVQTLMHHADIAMYHSKKQGKDRYSWFEPSMVSELRLRHEMEASIRFGIAAGEFVPYYEQQIDLETGELVGFEMLARWNSPKLGLTLPEVFIPIAEEIGVIGDLSEGLIIQAFADAKQWDPALTLAVNISPVQLRDPWFAEKILKLLVMHNFPPQRFEIEITETCMVENIALVRSMIENLRNQGIKISLDDFGAGYSTLEQLRSLPFDRLKIDRSFIAEVRSPLSSSKIVDAIVSLGNGLEMPITAEGIEDKQILDRLKTMGKMKGQGYYYGRPETATQVRERLTMTGRMAPVIAPGVIEGSQNDPARDDGPLPTIKRA